MVRLWEGQKATFASPQAANDTGVFMMQSLYALAAGREGPPLASRIRLYLDEAGLEGGRRQLGRQRFLQ